MAITRWFDETLVNTSVTGDQRRPVIAALNDGSFVVVWQDDEGGASVRAQRFGLDGQPLGSEFPVASGTLPDVAALPNGGFVISWTSGFDLYTQTFDAAGVGGAPLYVSSTSGNGQSVAPVGTGAGHVVVWQELSSGEEILAFIDDNGAYINVGPVNQSSTGVQSTPEVARLSDGGFVVVWADEANNSVMARIYEANGTPRTDEFAVSIGTVLTVPRINSVTALDTGGFVVSWDERNVDPSDVAVHGRLVSAAGVVAPTELALSPVGPADRAYSSIVALTEGRFMALWLDFNDGEEDLVAQVYDAAGAPFGEEFIVPTHGVDTGSEQMDATLLADGRVAVTWRDATAGTADGSGSGIRLQIIDPRDGLVPGTAGADTLYGNIGMDRIGGAGADLMFGLAGSDTYIVDDYGDIVDESLPGSDGIDTIEASISVDLGDTGRFRGAIEDVTLLGTALSAVGNGLDNILTGNAGSNALYGLGGADTLDGGGGADFLVGGTGADSYQVDNAADLVVEAVGEGFDIVSTTVSYALAAGQEIEILQISDSFDTAPLHLTGNEFGQVLYGNYGANRLDGRGGADSMTGLEGDDTYVVDDAGDVVDEAFFGTGFDTVESSVSVDLQDGARFIGDIERVILAPGLAGLNARGSGIANTLIGNSLANTLDGRGGADTLQGMAGDDSYHVDDAGDVVDESVAGSGGIDTVFAAVSVDLADAVHFRGDIENATALAGFTGVNLLGNALANTLTGNNVGNTLDGRGGADLMRGLGGFDIYYVDNIGDVVDESVSGSGGTDTVIASISVDLTDSARFRGAIERVTLVDGISGLSATGNGLANILTGNDRTNFLDGGAGADTLRGEGGSDIYIVDNAADLVFEAVGEGTNDNVGTSVSYALAAGQEIEGLSVADSLSTGPVDLTGNEFAQSLTGNDGVNRLDGRGGADLMIGYLGDDSYVIDDLGDQVDENPFFTSGGFDTVEASVSVDLADGARFVGDIERVILAPGIAGLNALGSGIANTLIGNNVGNTLNGRGGADIMRGMNGFDTYHVDNIGDVVDESVAGSGGTDTVIGSISIDLGDTAHFKGSIERAKLADGVTGLNATGNGLANLVTGNNLGNTLNGKAGKDTLTGGAGTDKFVFDSALSATTNVDTITDFNVKDDTIQLENAIFTLLTTTGTLAAGRFKNTANGAIDADDRIIYNHITGALTYDTNGSTSGGATQFAILSAGLALTEKDFVII